MSWRFFKKLSPENEPHLRNGSRVKFTSIDGGLSGYFGIDNDDVSGQLAQFIQEGRYGLTEISEKEFHADYVQKKTGSMPLRKPWREELGKNLTGNTVLSQIGPERVQAAVADDGSVKPVPNTVADVPASQVASGPTPQELLKTTKRPARPRTT